MNKWQKFVRELVAEHGYVQTKSKIFGDYASVDNMWKWTTGRRVPKESYAKLVMDLVTSGYIPSKKDWVTSMTDILEMQDFRLRAMAIGISVPLITSWEKGGIPVQGWVIPYLAEAIRRTAVPTDIEERKQMDENLAVEAETIVTRGELPERERRMVEMYHGLNGCERHSLAAVAKEFGLSRQRIHSIIKRAGVPMRPLSVDSVPQTQEQSRAY